MCSSDLRPFDDVGGTALNRRIDRGPLGSAREDGATGQAEQLAPMIARMIAALPGGFAAVDRLAVTVGPGYFTGLRAGLAAARGLALAAKRPLVGITTLAAVAAGVPLEERAGATIVVALDSKRSEAFFQLFSNDLMPAGEPETMAPGAYARKLRDLGGERLVVAGNGTALLGRALDGLGVAWCRSAAAERPDAALLADRKSTRLNSSH